MWPYIRMSTTLSFNRTRYELNCNGMALGLYPYAQSLSFSIGKKTIFKPAVWVEVGLQTNRTCKLGRPGSWLSESIFRFFASLMGQSPQKYGKKVGIQITINTKNGKKILKSGNLMKRTQQFFFSSETPCCVKARNHEQSSLFNNATRSIMTANFDSDLIENGRTDRDQD